MKTSLTPYRCKVWRIISSRFPPVDVFEDIAAREDFEALYQLESLTNDRLRNEAGTLTLLPKEECVFGPGAGYIMASFTHLNPEGSRFSDGSYGVFYAARELATAVEETKYHRALFLLRTREKPQEFDMRVLTAMLGAKLHDITGKKKTPGSLYDPNNYAASQAWAKPLRKQGASGIAYDSVRRNDGTCFAVFRPKSLSRCMQAQHLRYFWNGERISDVLELKKVG